MTTRQRVRRAVNFSPRRWESWAMLASVVVTLALATELIPAIGVWHKLGIVASGALAWMLGTAGRPAFEAQPPAATVPPATS